MSAWIGTLIEDDRPVDKANALLELQHAARDHNPITIDYKSAVYYVLVAGEKGQGATLEIAINDLLSQLYKSEQSNEVPWGV